MKVVLLTGLPGVGKTTTVNRIYSHYSNHGAKIGGITTHEVREGGQRTGFRITDLASGQEGWLARRDAGAGPRVGSYRVISEDLERIGVKSLERAVEGQVDMVIVDEIGPMEMTSPLFRIAISKLFNRDRPIIATVRFGSHYSEVEKIRLASLQLEMTKDNREHIYQRLVERIDDWMRS